MITTGGPRRGARRAGDRGTQAQDAEGGGAEPDLGGAGQKVRILIYLQIFADLELFPFCSDIFLR